MALDKKNTLAIASDHAGFLLKEQLCKFIRNSLEYKSLEVLDYGTSSSEDPVDYPDFAQRVCRAILSQEVERAILVCGTGIGVSISANRFRGIRAALCQSPFETKLSREHNDSNVLCLGAWILSEKLAKELLRIWLKTPFEGKRHQRRLDLIENNLNQDQE